MKKSEFDKRYRALRKRRSGLTFPDLPTPADLVAAAAGRPAEPPARKASRGLPMEMLRTVPRLKQSYLSEAQARRALRKLIRNFSD